MPIARSTGALIGTSESSLQAVANNATATSSETDLFGNNTSQGWVNLYLVLTSTATTGTFDETFYPSRVSGSPYASLAVLVGSVVPISGTQDVFLQPYSVGRYMTAAAKNNATGASGSVFFGYELFQLS